MKTLISAVSLIATMLTLTAPINVQAQAPDNKPSEAKADQRPPHEPPPQAYIDCKGKKEGDAVQITTPREKKIAAVCTTSPKGLFARPERPPHRDAEPNGNPPPKK